MMADYFRTAFLYFLLIIGSLIFTVVNAHAEKRVALVIGNSSYELAGTLLNPLNDATDMANSLEELGFDVVLGIDLKYNAMRNTLKKFSARLVGADVALFFYAGHAVQVKGTNYLAPVDTDIERESDLEFETVALDVVQKLMEREAKTQLVFLDACRNNPLTRQLLTRSRALDTGTGLARQQLSAEGSYIAFATQPGNVALDGTGRNSPFTSALLKNLKRPGIEISALMTDVRRDVYESTGKQQLPWTNSGLLGHFYFAPSAKVSDDVKNATTENSDNITQFQRENAKWDAIKDTNNPMVIRRFMAEFPNSVLTSLAQFKLDQIELAARQQRELQLQSEKIRRLEQLEQQRLASLQLEEKNVRIEPGVPESSQRPITAQIVRSIQSDFNRLGCNAGTPDGKWGRKSISALSLFSKHADKKFASTDPTIELYDDLRTRSNRVCPLICSARHNKRDNQCVLKTCAGGEKLNNRGVCYKPSAQNKSKPVRQASKNTKTKRNTVKKPSRSNNCFQFNGKTVCE